MEPVREAPALADTLNATEPFPLPEAPDVTVIHDALLEAVHAQLLAADTLTESVVPEAGTF